MSVPKPYILNASSEFVEWVTDRVKTARIIPDLNHPAGEEWSYGIPTTVMEPLVEHWKTKYDWRSMEQKINDTFKMFTVDLEEADEQISLHFVHHRSERTDAIPLIFAHGWPGNFMEVENLLKLTDPEDPKAQAFSIVAPSIPGFVLSSSPTKPGFGLVRIASLYHKLMLKLGYHTYVGQGGDWGSFILRSMALQFPASCVGIHINFVITLPPSFLQHPITLFFLAIRWFTAEQKKRLARMIWWLGSEAGYSRIQGTKPQTVSYALLDSPVGMLAWIREKVQNLVEDDNVWNPDRIITWTMLYLISGSAGHARIYKEGVSESRDTILSRKISKDVAMGISCFPKDVGYVPKWWADATIGDNIVMWREHDQGGHFPSVECEDVLLADLQEWIQAIRDKDSSAKWEALLRAGSASN